MLSDRSVCELHSLHAPKALLAPVSGSLPKMPSALPVLPTHDLKAVGLLSLDQERVRRRRWRHPGHSFLLGIAHYHFSQWTAQTASRQSSRWHSKATPSFGGVDCRMMIKTNILVHLRPTSAPHLPWIQDVKVAAWIALCAVVELSIIRQTFIRK